LKDNVEAARARNRIDVRKFAVARLAPKKYGGHISDDVQGNTTLNFQPAVVIRVESSAAPEAGSGVLLDGDGDMYGGAADSGKSHLIRAPAISWCSVSESLPQLVAQASSRGLLSINTARPVLSWSGWRHSEGPTSASIQNVSGVPQGPAGRFRGILSLL
jgi:hypothetical protein